MSQDAVLNSVFSGSQYHFFFFLAAGKREYHIGTSRTFYPSWPNELRGMKSYLFPEGRTVPQRCTGDSRHTCRTLSDRETNRLFFLLAVAGGERRARQ